MTVLNGAMSIVHTLRAHDVQYVFGLPGTTVVPLLDSIVGLSDIDYLLGVHEGSLLAMADGYARFSGKPAFVNIHMMPGTANALGPLYASYRDRVPLVVTVGEQNSRIMGRDTFTETPDMKEMYRQVSKWTWTVPRADRLPEALTRAFKVACTPPQGPVVLCIPKDFFDEEADVAIPEPERYPPPAAVEGGGAEMERAAAMLLGAENPWVISGSGVVRDGAVELMRELAELLALPVCTEPWYHRLGLDADHPLYFGMFRPGAMAPEGADVVLGVGARMFVEFDYDPNPLLPPEARVIQIDADPWEIGKIYPADVGVVSDSRRGLAGLLAAVKALKRPAHENAIEARRKRLAARQQARRQALEEEMRREWDAVPISQPRLSREILEAMPPNGILVNESITAAHSFSLYPEPYSYVGNGPGFLGWGLGAATGAKLACPDRPVVAAVGDGCFLFGLQALWGSARHRLPIVVVVYDNRTYMAVKGTMAGYKGETSDDAQRLAVPTNLDDPHVDYVSLARGFNADAVVVERPEEIRPALEKALASNRTTVLDVIVDPRATGRGGVKTP